MDSREGAGKGEEEKEGRRERKEVGAMVLFDRE